MIAMLRSGSHFEVITIIATVIAPAKAAIATQRQRPERERAPRPPLAAHLGEPRRAVDRDREDQGHAHPRDQRVDDRLQQGLGVDHRRDAAPCSHRRHRRRLAHPAGEGERDQRQPDRGDDQRPRGPVAEDAAEAVDRRAHQRRRGHGQQPGRDDVAGDAPAHRREPLAGARRPSPRPRSPAWSRAGSRSATRRGSPPRPRPGPRSPGPCPS